MRDQHLAVATYARADADGGDGNFLGDELRQPRRDRFEHEAETARLFEQERVFEQALRGGGVPALRTEAAQLVDGLRREAEVPHDGNARADDGAHRVRAFAPAFEFDRLHARLLQEASRVADGFIHVRLVGHERHVADQQRGLCAARHRAAVMEHLLHRDGQGVGVTQHDHAERIADEDGVHARRVHGERGGIVVGGEHGDGLAARLLLAERERRHFFALGRGRRNTDSRHGTLQGFGRVRSGSSPFRPGFLVLGFLKFYFRIGLPAFSESRTFGFLKPSSSPSRSQGYARLAFGRLKSPQSYYSTKLGFRL